MSVTHNYAQTNLQLYSQLRRDGYSPEDLNHVRLTYDFAKELFTSRYIANGKPFIAHLLGTASILGSLRVSKEIISAGLLHATYLHGDFGDSQTGFSTWKQQQVRLRVGHQTEEYIAKYDAFRWNKSTIPTIQRSFDTLDAFDRQILLMRLANELEEFLDLGILFVGKVQERLKIYQNWGHVHVELADRLGYQDLAYELSRAFEDTLGELPAHLENLQNSVREDCAFTLLPGSYQYCPWTSLRRTLNQGTNHFTVGSNKESRHPIIDRIISSSIIQFLKRRMIVMSRA